MDYKDSRENRDKIEAIRSAWKRETGDLSVLRVTQPVEANSLLANSMLANPQSGD